MASKRQRTDDGCTFLGAHNARTKYPRHEVMLASCMFLRCREKRGEERKKNMLST